MRIDKPDFNLTGPLSPSGVKDKARDLDFVDTLKEAIDSANTVVRESERAASDLSSGKAPTIHEAMIAMQKADIDIRLLVAVTNKLIDAYNQLTQLR